MTDDTPTCRICQQNGTVESAPYTLCFSAENVVNSYPKQPIQWNSELNETEEAKKLTGIALTGRPVRLEECWVSQIAGIRLFGHFIGQCCGLIFDHQFVIKHLPWRRS
jgi:hypothetical protein